MKLKSKYLLAPILALSLAAAPFSNAEARGYGHGGYHGGGGHFGRGFGVGAAVGGLLVGTALLLTAPIRAVGEAVAPGPDYYEPPQQQAYYAPRPVYTQQYVEAPPTYYYAPAPRYYAPRYYAPAAAYYPY